MFERTDLSSSQLSTSFIWIKKNNNQYLIVIFFPLKIDANCLSTIRNNERFINIRLVYFLRRKSKRPADTVSGTKESVTTTDFVDELSMTSTRPQKSVSGATLAASPGPSTAVRSMRLTIPLCPRLMQRMTGSMYS